MRKKILTTLLALTLIMAQLLNMTGCSSKVQAEDLMKGVEAEKVELIEDMQEGNLAVTDFAVHLMQESLEEKENTLLSPLSVLYALAMTANGAKNETLAQMEGVLGMERDALNQYLYTYNEKLANSDKYRLSIANSIWFRDDERLTVREDFLQTNANYYGADIYKSPFDDSTLKDINNWVKNKTDGMIPEIIDEISMDVVMYLINALAFEAEWENIYEETQIRDGKFTLEDGTEREVEFMYSAERDYIEDENAKGFVKYYLDSKYAFVALLPDEDVSVADYIASLSGKDLKEMLDSAEKENVQTSIPKFETEYSVDMSRILAKMGMTDAFDGDIADLTGIGTSTRGNLFINRVLHKTFITVDERGTKAGATTVVEVADEAGVEMVGEPKRVYLDRPFVYMIIECKNNTPIFVGTMMDVEEK